MLLSTHNLILATSLYTEEKRKSLRRLERRVKLYISFYLFVSVVLFILELILMTFAVNIAMRCGNDRRERIIHVLLAVLFTIPYLLFSMFFGKCKSNLMEIV